MTVSSDPTDRPSMKALTALLRELAAKTAARAEAIAAPPTSAGSFANAGGHHADPILMSPEDILDGVAAAAPADVKFSQEMGGGGEAVTDLEDTARWTDSLTNPDSGSPASGPVGLDSGGDGYAPEGSVSEERSSPYPGIGQLVEGEEDAQRIPSLEEIAEWVQLTPPPIVVPTAERGTDSAGAAVPPVEIDEAGRGAIPSAAKLLAEERTLNVVMPSLEEIVGWADLPPLPFPGSAAEALANRREEAPEASLRGPGVHPMGDDLPPYIYPRVEVARVVDVALATVPASPNVGPSYIGSGSSDSDDSGGVGVRGGDSSGSGSTSSSWEGPGGGDAQAGGEVGVMLIGPDASLTFTEVLARGFDTSTPAVEVATPPASPHPHPRPRPRPPPGRSGSSAASAPQITSVSVREESTTPAVLLTPSAILQADRDRQVTPSTRPVVKARPC